MLVRPGISPFEAFNHPGGVDAFYAAEKSAIDAIPPVSPPAWPDGEPQGIAQGMSWKDAVLAELGFSSQPGVGRAHAEFEQGGIDMAERIAKHGRIFFPEGRLITDDVPERKLAADGTKLALFGMGIAWYNRRRRIRELSDI